MALLPQSKKVLVLSLSVESDRQTLPIASAGTHNEAGGTAGHTKPKLITLNELKLQTDNKTEQYFLFFFIFSVCYISSINFHFLLLPVHPLCFINAFLLEF